MIGIDYLLDTNAILYFLSGNECMEPYVSGKIAYSIISEIELLSYTKISYDEEEIIKRFLKKNISVSISEEVKKRTIQIRKKYNIKLPDAIIAASAIENNLVFLTADLGFAKVKELKLELIKP